MQKLVECIPNFSEGRRKDVIDRIAGAVRGVVGVRLLDVAPNPDHNRTVLTFVGALLGPNDGIVVDPVRVVPVIVEPVPGRIE